MTTLEVSHLYKAKTEVFLKWILGERGILGSLAGVNTVDIYFKFSFTEI